MRRKRGHRGFHRCRACLDTSYARRLGVNCDELLVSQPDTGEQALEITDMLLRSGAIDVMVIDSVAALVPRAEIEGEMGDAHMGLQARLMSQALRKLTGTIGKNQHLPDFHQPDPHEDRCGLRQSRNHHRRQRVEVLCLCSSGHPTHRRHQERSGCGRQPHPVKVVKNKMAPPFKEAEFDITYGDGISQVGDLLDIGVESGIIEKSGAWYAYKGERIGQGRENVKSFLLENTDLYALIDQEVRGSVGIVKSSEETVAEPEM
jgi:recombination protein RecA